MATTGEINPDRLPPTERAAYFAGFVRCKCKMECTSKKCSCLKHGLKCVTACGNCRGDCTNSKVLVILKVLNFAIGKKLQFAGI